MDERQVEQILQNPKFKEMVSRKSKLSWTLTTIMLVVYVGFMLLVGYNKEFLMTSQFNLAALADKAVGKYNSFARPESRQCDS